LVGRRAWLGRGRRSASGLGAPGQPLVLPPEDPPLLLEAPRPPQAGGHQDDSRDADERGDHTGDEDPPEGDVGQGGAPKIDIGGARVARDHRRREDSCGSEQDQPKDHHGYQLLSTRRKLPALPPSLPSMYPPRKPGKPAGAPESLRSGVPR